MLLLVHFLQENKLPKKHVININNKKVIFIKQNPCLDFMIY
jgi:hypothetical protein